jgi:hypothetical protein
MTSLQDRALLPKRQVLHEQNLLAAKESSERAEAERKQADYGLSCAKFFAAELSSCY